MLCLTRRELETWPWWNCDPITPSKERGWKPSTYRARASSRPYENDKSEWANEPAAVETPGGSLNHRSERVSKPGNHRAASIDTLDVPLKLA